VETTEKERKARDTVPALRVLGWLCGKVASTADTAKQRMLLEGAGTVDRGRISEKETGNRKGEDDGDRDDRELVRRTKNREEGKGRREASGRLRGGGGGG